MPGWSDYGFDQPRLKPLSLLFEGLLRAYGERCELLDLPRYLRWDELIEELLSRTPGEIVNWLLENLCARECLEATFSTAERLPYYQQADHTTSIYDAHENWWEFAQEAYFARMEELFGFDIRKGVPPLRPLDAELFAALRTAIAGLRYSDKGHADYTCHMRFKDKGVWEEWRRVDEGSYITGTCDLGGEYSPSIDPETGIDYGYAWQIWMFEGDNIYCVYYAKDPELHPRVEGYLMKCVRNDLVDILPEYSPGTWYAHIGETWNPADGVSPPAPSIRIERRYYTFDPEVILDLNSLFEFQADELPEG